MFKEILKILKFNKFKKILKFKKSKTLKIKTSNRMFKYLSKDIQIHNISKYFDFLLHMVELLAHVEQLVMKVPETL
jgi:hypothetical protein